ncbi:MAG TPA: VTT domain-containing protein [Acidobacteriaceae bacterium]|nr:VTT domain-containing protein [Acidobacteriaceae bacterium]
MKFFLPLLHFIFSIGYFGPLLMGVLDSSFLVLPFGNDILVVGLVAHNHHGIPLYVLSAACGSTIGALLLALVSRKIGEEGISRLAGQKRYEKLKNRIGSHAGPAIALGGLAPPPFPFTMVIAAAAALDYSLWKLLAINFLTRACRFALLSWLALKFGQQVMAIAKSKPFEWGMAAFIFLCIVGSAYSLWRWFRHSRRGE